MHLILVTNNRILIQRTVVSKQNYNHQNKGEGGREKKTRQFFNLGDIVHTPLKVNAEK